MLLHYIFIKLECVLWWTRWGLITSISFSLISKCFYFIIVFTFFWFWRLTWIWIRILLRQPYFSLLFTLFNCFFKWIYFLKIFVLVLKSYNWLSWFKDILFFTITLFVILLSCSTYSKYIHEKLINRISFLFLLFLDLLLLKLNLFWL